MDLATLTGTGPEGAITYADVERGAEAPPVAPAVAERKRAPSLDLDAIRVAIAASMARSKRDIPHYYLAHDVDVMACEQWLTEINAGRPPENRLLMGALTLKAVALAAKRYPAFNGFYQDNTFELAPAVHVGVAVAIRGGGLAAPALHDVDQLSLDDLMVSMRDLVQRTRAGRIRSRNCPIRPSPSPASVNAVSRRSTASSIRRRWRSSASAKWWCGPGSSTAPSAHARWSPSRCQRIIASAMGTRGRCSWPKSADCCRSPKSYERHRHQKSGPGRTQQHRAGGRLVQRSIPRRTCARRSTSIPWTSSISSPPSTSGSASIFPSSIIRSS